MYLKSIIVPILASTLVSCNEDHRETSFSLQAELNDMSVTCEDLNKPKTGKLFWVKPVLDGTGILLITQTNKQE